MPLDLLAHFGMELFHDGDLEEIRAKSKNTFHRAHESLDLVWDFVFPDVEVFVKVKIDCFL